MSNEKKIEIEKSLYDILNKNHLYPEEIGFFTDTVVKISIACGDWKHEHLRLRWLLSELGYQYISSLYISSLTTEDDGSDCYSADHYFAIPA